MSRHPVLAIGLVALWIVGVLFGLRLLDYRVPGARAVAALRWPDASKLPHGRGQFTLVLFLHPHCPCSGATLDAFADLVARSGQRIAAVVAFVVPPGAPAGWELTPLYHRANTLTELRVEIDRDGIEAERFGALTSGHVVLYAPDEHLAYQGGITPIGCDAVLACLYDETSTAPETAIFGCPLFDREARCAEDSRCQRR